MTAELTALDPEALKYFLLHSGVFIAALGAVFFLLGFWCGRKTPPRQAPAPVTNATAAVAAPPTPPAPPAVPPPSPAPPIEEKPAAPAESTGTATPASLEIPAPPSPPEPALPPASLLENAPLPPLPMTNAHAAPMPETVTPMPAAPGLPEDGVLKAIARSQGVILPPVDAFSFLLLDDPPPPPPRCAQPARAPLLCELDDSGGSDDDLTRIRGITSELEAKLRSLGIRRWRQIAALSGAQVRELSRRLAFKDRIEREEWQTQARALTAASTCAAPPPGTAQGA